MQTRLIPKLAWRNLRSDRFATGCAILGVALGTATVNVVLTLDLNTRAQEAWQWSTNPDLAPAPTIGLRGYTHDGRPTSAQDAKEETHEDYQVMRSAIRLGSLSAFLVGALIVFFTFRVVVEQRRREVALLRSLGATKKQVAGIFFFEALIIGAFGAALGLIATIPLTVGAAWSGITTTGRSRLWWLFFPWKLMLVVSTIGGATALLGVAKPLLEILRLDVAKTLRPQFLEDKSVSRRRASGLTLIALPFMALLYVLIRPFFTEVLPSLAFFVFEAGLVCAGFLSLLVLVPELVSLLGGQVARLIPYGPKAARLLTQRRLSRSGHDLAWGVSGVMLVFALLLSLHVVTHSLKREVVAWAAPVVRGHAYVYNGSGEWQLPSWVLDNLDPQTIVVGYSSRSTWPNALMAVDTAALPAYAATMEPKDAQIFAQLAPGKIVLSTMMSRRYGISSGDYLEVKGRNRTARLLVVGISDAGYMPMIGPYRDSKTYGLIADGDFDLIEGFAAPIGSGYLLRAPPNSPIPSIATWREKLEPAKKLRDVRIEVGEAFEAYRLRETDKDFAIFDVILLLTALLAAVGIANNLVLAAHVRRREIALYRVLGMATAEVRALFLMEGGFIGLLGGLMAVGLGIPLGFAAVSALQVISAFQVQFELPLRYVFSTIGAAVAIALVAAVYPALRAGRFFGAEAVHYE